MLTAGPLDLNAIVETVKVLAGIGVVVGTSLAAFWGWTASQKTKNTGAQVAEGNEQISAQVAALDAALTKHESDEVASMGRISDTLGRVEESVLLDRQNTARLHDVVLAFQRSLDEFHGFIGETRAALVKVEDKNDLAMKEIFTLRSRAKSLESRAFNLERAMNRETRADSIPDEAGGK